MPTQEYRNSQGIRLPGVTTVINNLGWKSDGLVYWAYKLGKEGKDLNKAREGAADIGTIAHDLFEKHVHGDTAGYEAAVAAAPEEFREPALDAVAGAMRWLRQSRGLIIATEMWGIDEEYQTGFCIDALRIEDDNTLALLDWKTSKGTYPDHLIQIAAYTKFVERKLSEWGGAPVVLTGGAHLCRFSKDGGNFVHHHWTRKQLDAAWSAFTWLRGLHGVRKQLESLCK